MVKEVKNNKEAEVEEQAYKTAVKAVIKASRLVLKYWPNLSNPQRAFTYNSKLDLIFRNMFIFLF